MAGDLLKAKVTKTIPLSDSEAKWIKIEKLFYTDPLGKERDWEFASRRTRVKGSDCDGVGILAIITAPKSIENTYKTTEYPKIVLQKQFRPPTGGVCIEFPAGLLDPNESILTCAIRELKEETGLLGQPSPTPVMVKPTSTTGSSTTTNKNIDINNQSESISCVMFSDPGFCNTNLQLVTLYVDMDKEENKNPVTQLEDNEFIESFMVPLKNLPDYIKKFVNEGYKIDARVQNIAQGITLARKFSL